MSTKISACSSTSTTDLSHRPTITIDSYSQTLNVEHDDDDYTDYEESKFQKPSVASHEKNIRKSDQTTLCRVKRYSVACWTKPAYLLAD